MAATTDETSNPAHTIEVLWGQKATPRRGPRPAFTLTDIAQAAITIADTDGLAAATMHRVAQHLGVTKMALYRYVRGKDELIALMTEAGLGAPPPPDTQPRHWRSQLDTWAHHLYDRFCRHPWALETTVGTRIMGPHELSWIERALAALTDTGLHGSEKLDIAVTLIGHARTIAQQGTAATTDTPEQAMHTTMTTLLHGREDQYPALVEALTSANTHGTTDQALDFGLNRILDGVEHLITSRATRDPATPDNT
ncbi:MAG: TetR/AcrR family transcriptional regulator [Actinocatenispora sp.]